MLTHYEGVNSELRTTLDLHGVHAADAYLAAIKVTYNALPSRRADDMWKRL